MSAVAPRPGAANREKRENGANFSSPEERRTVEPVPALSRTLPAAACTLSSLALGISDPVEHAENAEKGKKKRRRKRPNSFFKSRFMEAEVGIEPASTALQAVCCLIVQWLTTNATRSATRSNVGSRRPGTDTQLKDVPLVSLSRLSSRQVRGTRIRRDIPVKRDCGSHQSHCKVDKARWIDPKGLVEETHESISRLLAESHESPDPSHTCQSAGTLRSRPIYGLRFSICEES